MGWFGLALMLVGFGFAYFGEFKQKPKEEPVVEAPAPRDDRYDQILRELSSLRVSCQKDDLLGRLEGLEKKIDAVELTFKAQKPPIIHMPNEVTVEIKDPVKVTGGLNLTTKKPLKVLHRAVKKPTKAQMDKLKKQVDALAK